MRIQIKKYFRNIDMPLLVSVLLLITIGIILIGSATHANVPGPKRYSFVLRQLSFAGINLVLGAFLLRFDYRVLKQLARPLYIFNIVMLLCVMLFVSSKIAGRSAVYFAKQQKDLGAVNGYIEEMMAGQKVVKVFCHEEKSLEDFRQLNQSLRDSADKANTFANIAMPVNGNLGNISYVLCAAVGALLALSGHSGLTLGTLVAFLNLNKNATQPVSQISQQTNSIVMAMAGAQRVFDLMDAAPETDNGYVDNWISAGEREHDWEVLEVDYDGHNATDLAIKMCEERNNEDFCVEISQTCAGQNLAVKTFRELLLQGQIVLEESPLVLWCLANAIEIQNNYGDIKLSKKHKDDTERIDPVAAAMNALARALIHRNANDLSTAIGSGEFTL